MYKKVCIFGVKSSKLLARIRNERMTKRCPNSSTDVRSQGWLYSYNPLHRSRQCPWDHYSRILRSLAQCAYMQRKYSVPNFDNESAVAKMVSRVGSKLCRFLGSPPPWNRNIHIRDNCWGCLSRIPYFVCKVGKATCAIVLLGRFRSSGVGPWRDQTKLKWRGSCGGQKVMPV